MFRRVRRVHMVGIGGAGMCGIAEILLNLGFAVTGSDIARPPVIERLERLGAQTCLGHDESNVGMADVVVVSSAIKPENPEVEAAKQKNIPVIRRAEMLAELMRLKYGIAIAGTHGKTTTTSMVGQVLFEGNLDPTLVVGGLVKSTGTGAKVGSGDYLVAEADEFDRSFLSLSPTIAVVTNIESEHLDCYRDLDEIKEAFVTFLNKVPFYGSAVVCIDEQGVRDILGRMKRKLVTFGISPEAHYSASDLSFQGLSSSFILNFMGKHVGEISLNVPGIHNVKNALAAVSVGYELDIDFDSIQKALSSFTGVHRRFEVKGEPGGILIVDDYAHHPTEIEASLKGTRAGWGDRRIIVVFQPHLYSRTKMFHKEFGSSFKEADMLIVTDVYPAREEPIEGVTGELIANSARESGHTNVLYVGENDKEKVCETITAMIERGDIVITVGAGDIWKVSDRLLELIS
ncbi:MAG: UDP-N-acetylmuramate--L-alanine ligase [Candidatus Glassbacteria bacterium]